MANKQLIDLYSVDMDDVDISDCTDIKDILSAVVTYLAELSTVDAVEVVRCQDCKHRHDGKDCTHPLLLSYSWGALRNVKDDDFCSYGERKGGSDAL